MNAMKRVLVLPAVLCASFAALALAATAQDGSIEFVARVTPAGGVEEPVRGFPFYLLSESFEQIKKDADAAFPKPDMNEFIAKLEVSDELKAWMKKNQCVSLKGDDFIHKVKPDDIIAVPEFFHAYVDRNSGDQSIQFPKSKAKLSDKTKNPAKYDKLTQDYKDAIHNFAETNPQTIDGMDLNLSAVDPGPQWDALGAKRTPEIQRRVLELSQSKYLVARTETDLQGQGFLRDIPPGTYWLSTLAVSARVGDANLRWDAPVTVRADETAYITLVNSNSVQALRASP